jgi:hypothetical protein
MMIYDIFLIICGMYVAQEYNIPNVKENVLMILAKFKQNF